MPAPTRTTFEVAGRSAAYLKASSSSTVSNGTTLVPDEPPINLNVDAAIIATATTASTSGVRGSRRSRSSRTNATSNNAQIAIGRLLGLVPAQSAINSTV